MSLAVRERPPVATAWSLICILVVWLPEQLLPVLLGEHVPVLPGIGLTVAVVMDLLDEAQARGTRTWTPVWPLHRMDKVEPALGALKAGAGA